MTQTRTMEIAVGLFIALGLAAVLVLALKASNIAAFTGQNGYPVIAKFQNIGGIHVRSPVSMAGVRIGRVAEIGFDDETYQAVLKLDINPKYNKLPADTSASILTSGLLGEQYVGLEPGGAEDYLEAGDEITITQSAVVLEKLIGQFIFNQAGGGDL